MAVKNLRSTRRRSYTPAPPLRYDAIETGAGPVSFATDGERLQRIELGREHRDERRATPLDREVKRQLNAYFRRRRSGFDLPFALDMPRFTTRVLRAVEKIPFGKTLSYGEVASRVGNPKAARAVGNAVGANPLPLLIPCHRVLAAEGRIGGFGGGLDWKRFLLDLEGGFSICDP